jgi:hypothetical protein
VTEYVIADRNDDASIRRAWIELGAKIFGAEYGKEAPVYAFGLELTESDLQAVRDGRVIVVGISDMEYTLHIRIAEGQ